MSGRILLAAVLSAVFAVKPAHAQSDFDLRHSIEAFAAHAGPADVLTHFSHGPQTGALHLDPLNGACRDFELRLTSGGYAGRLCRVSDALGWRVTVFKAEGGAIARSWPSPPASRPIIAPRAPSGGEGQKHDYRPTILSGGEPSPSYVVMTPKRPPKVTANSMEYERYDPVSPEASTTEYERYASASPAPSVKDHERHVFTSPPASGAPSPPPVTSAEPEAHTAAPALDRHERAPVVSGDSGAAPPDAAPYGEPSPAASTPAPVTGRTARLLRQLQSMPIAYNKPNRLSFDQDTQITLVVEGLGAGSAKDTLNGLTGAQVAGSALLSPQVTARLTGPSDEVSIERESAETQEVSAVANTSWVWQVRAKKPGQTTLTLEVDANVMIDGKATPLQVRTYSDRFPISMSPISWSAYEVEQIDPTWKFLGLGTPVAIIGGVWAWMRRRRRVAAAGQAPAP